MALTIINTKASAELKEAIRIVAFKQGHSNSSKTITDILQADPEIARELKKLQSLNRKEQKKVA